MADPNSKTLIGQAQEAIAPVLQHQLPGGDPTLAQKDLAAFNHLDLEGAAAKQDVLHACTTGERFPAYFNGQIAMAEMHNGQFSVYGLGNHAAASSVNLLRGQILCDQLSTLAGDKAAHDKASGIIVPLLPATATPTAAHEEQPATDRTLSAIARDQANHFIQRQSASSAADPQAVGASIALAHREVSFFAEADRRGAAVVSDATQGCIDGKRFPLYEEKTGEVFIGWNDNGVLKERPIGDKSAYHNVALADDSQGGKLTTEEACRVYADNLAKKAETDHSLPVGRVDTNPEHYASEVPWSVSHCAETVPVFEKALADFNAAKKTDHPIDYPLGEALSAAGCPAMLPKSPKSR